MRRRRLPARRAAGGTALARVPGPGGGLVELDSRYDAEPITDLKYLEQVVAIGFPVRAAIEFLQRNMANRVTYKLVEVHRGEPVGTVREVEIHHANSGERTFVRGERVLANGEPASFYVPDHLVTIRARIDGSARRSRSLGVEDEVILHVPVRGYLRFLPAIFQGEGPVHSREVLRARATELQKYRGGELPEEAAIELDPDEDPLRRFLFVFQHVMTSISNRIDHVVDLTDPMMTEAKLLPWLASWVGFDLDESLPVHQQRELVRRAIRLMRTRGTRTGIEEMVRVLTSAPVRVEERTRPAAATLGKAVLIGGSTVVERFQRGEPAGAYLMEPTASPTTSGRSPTSFFTLRLEPRERFQNRFGERAAHVLRRIVKVVSQEKPSHVSFTIRFDERR
ncbi:MAG: phage tail protein [Myxococcota bacterium]